MGLKYENDLLGFLGIKKEFLRDDFDYLSFKQSLLHNKDNEDLFDNLIKLLSEEEQAVKINAIKSIYFLLVELTYADEQVNELIKNLITTHNIDIEFSELGV